MSSGHVYVKIEHDEAVDKKRILLNTEVDTLKVTKIIKKYKLLRIREMALKNKLRINMNATLLLLKKLQREMPHQTLPKIIQKDDEKISRELRDEIQTYSPESKSKEKETHAFSEIEAELIDIQRKLRELGE